jgi:uncharacterized protein YgiM (DUF1202 family)
MKYLGSLLLIVVLLLPSISYAQEPCSDNFDEEYSRGYDAYQTGDYETAISIYTCAISLIPSDITGGLEVGNSYAGVYLNRAWAYLQNGDYALTHNDFYRWIELTEQTGVDATLDETLANGNFQIVPNDIRRMSFEGEAGQVWGFSVMSEDATDPLIVLLAPDDSVLIADDDGGINLNSVIRRYTLPQTGTYTLVLGQAGGWGVGEVELAVYQDGTITSTNPDNPNVAFSFAAYNLYVGETAEVFTTGGDSLNMRAEPNTNAEIIDRLELGELVTLLQGPYKEDGGYAWWRIRNNEGLEGWAVERVETEQTLQLALFTGEEALVTSAPDLLNVRGEPNRSSDVVFQLEDGDVVTLLDEAPVIADGLRWWHLRDAEGREGWAVDRIGIERTLAPLREFPTQ